MTSVENNLIKTKDYSDDYAGYFLPVQVIYQIEKYDINSIVSNLFKYKKAKTDFLAFRLHSFNDTTDSLTKLVVRANSYAQEKKFLKVLDSLLDVISSLNTPNNIHKYRDFFNLHYPDGLATYIQEEKDLLIGIEQRDFEHFKYFLFRDVFNYAFDSTFVLYQKDTIPLYIVADSSSKYLTMDIGHDPLNNIFVTGVVKTGKTIKVYVAKITKHVLHWVKFIPVPQGYSVLSAKIYPYTDGVVVDICQENMENTGYNSFYRFDQVGNRGFSFRSDVDFVPRSIFYDDINNYMVVAYKGRDKVKSYSPGKLVLEKWDVSQKKNIWRLEFDHTGDFVNIIRFDSVYYAFVNYNRFVDNQGKVYSSTSNSIGVIRITESGEMLSFTPIEKAGQFYLVYSLKLSSEKFNLLGFQTEPFDFRKQSFNQLPALRSIIINKF